MIFLKTSSFSDSLEKQEHKFFYQLLNEEKLLVTGGRRNRYLSLEEKFVNCLMKQGRNTGKKNKTYNIFLKTLEKIGTNSKNDPLSVFYKAIFEGMPYRGVRRQKKGSKTITKGIYYSNYKRLIISINNLTLFVSKNRKKKRGIIEELSKEIILASTRDSSSYLISKKIELEKLEKDSNY
jgi:ribosomal protein S7